MAPASESAVKNIGKVLNDPTRPMKERFRALFTLRNLGGETAIECISQCFIDESVLLKHELAYCLGQMQDERAIPVLRSVLEDKNQDPIVRHEAGEALGAIGDPKLRELLEKYQHDPAVEVAETCQIALQRLNWVANDCTKESNLSKSLFTSIDPAPPSSESNVENLKNTLTDESKTLFERYRAMFSLRNLGTTESINALGEVTVENRPSYAQLEGLVEFLEQNPGIAKGLLWTAQGKLETKRKWENLATTLNSLGGANKNGQGWAKYWAEKKCALKKQCAEVLASMRRTGGGTADNLPTLSALDNRLVAVMGGQEFATGDARWTVNPFPQSTRPTESPVVIEHGETVQEDMAMDSMQNISPIPGTSQNDAIPATSTSFKASSALFRHEVAFVFGQMQDERSVPFLKKTLEDINEHEMVRHEAAEALGSIATEECTEVLQRYLQDPRPVVRESCEVALDMSEYENSPEFQYANTLLTVEG